MQFKFKLYDTRFSYSIYFSWRSHTTTTTPNNITEKLYIYTKTIPFSTIRFSPTIFFLYLHQNQERWSERNTIYMYTYTERYKQRATFCGPVYQLVHVAYSLLSIRMETIWKTFQLFKFLPLLKRARKKPCKPTNINSHT